MKIPLSLFMVRLLLVNLIFLSMASASESDICLFVHDFITDVYDSGSTTFTTQQLSNLTNNINQKLGDDLSTTTISGYISDYPNKCYGYEELPASYLVEVLKEVSTPEDKSIWDRHRYEIVFFSLIIVGVFGMRYLKNRKI